MDRSKRPGLNPRSFLRSEDGNTTILGLYMTVAIIIITGAAVDIMHYESVRTKMQHSLDRAVLAAADLDQMAEPTSVVQDYMLHAGVVNGLGDVIVDQGTSFRTVTASGNTDVPTYFMKMTGVDSLDAQATSTAEEKIANVEISMVLDISGSMRWDGRIANLRTAAKGFVDKVMTEDSNGVTTLNLVPYAGHVNPGDILFDYFRGERPDIPVTDDPTTGEVTTDQVLVDDGVYFEEWAQAISNVVFYFDTNGDDIYDRAHKIEGFPEDAPRDVDDFYRGAVAFLIANNPELTDPSQFLGASIKGGVQTTSYYQVKGDENGELSDIGPTKNRRRIPGNTYQYASVDFAGYADQYVSPNQLAETADVDPLTTDQQPVNMPSSCVEIAPSEFDTAAMPTGSDYVPHFMYWAIDEETMDWGWCPGEDTAIQYYSDDAAQLNDFISDMRLHDGTGTQYGMKYGLALLNPDNRSAVSHLISEGLVNAKFEGRPIDWNDSETEKYILLMTDGFTTDQYRPNDPTNPDNGSVALSQQAGNPSYQMTAGAANNADLLSQCTLAKSLGVTIFTVAFETDSAAAETMSACASSESHFFNVSGADIVDAFDVIGRQINNLRLIQ